MNISLNWLREYVDLGHLTAQEISQHLTSIGLEVEGVAIVSPFPATVVTGKILTAERHPNADSLQVCQVDVGEPSHLTIVCGAPNARADLHVAVALIGSELPGGFKIKEAKIRGQTSCGMLCSAKELGLGSDHGGIMELTAGPLGKPVSEVLHLADTVLTLNITPNRGDCLGYIGVARELAAKLHKELKLPSVLSFHQLPASPVKVTIKSAECSHFTAVQIKGVPPEASSPGWLSQRLTAAGLRPISLLVDLTNYVMLEANQPMHAYDSRFVTDSQFVIRTAAAGETLETLDGQTITLSESDLVIADSSKPLGLAGVMGGKQSEIRSDSQDILLEVAAFAAPTIRKTAKRLALHTDASHRFERGTDVTNIAWAAGRFCELLLQATRETAATQPKPQIFQAVASSNKETPRHHIAWRWQKAESLLGISFDKQAARKTLTALGLSVTKESPTGLDVEIPSWRWDLTQECDVTEELARHMGFDAIPELIPPTTSAPLPQHPFILFSESCRQSFGSLGFRETVTFPFWSLKNTETFRIPKTSAQFPQVTLANPLSEDERYLATSLTPGLVLAAAKNKRHGAHGARLFELGRGFYPATPSQTTTSWEKDLSSRGWHLANAFARGETTRPSERFLAAGIIDQPWAAKRWQGGEENATFFHLKDLLTQFFTALKLTGIEWKNLSTTDVSFLHPKAGAHIFSHGTWLGYAGELHPETALKLEFDVEKPPVVFELDLENVFCARAAKKNISTTATRFPPSLRDLAFLVPQHITHQMVCDVLGRFPQKRHLSSYQLFDVYTGDNIPAGKKNLAYAFEFRSTERTLNDQEVETELGQIGAWLSKNIAAELRA